jgi:hypothetical protein
VSINRRLRSMAAALISVVLSSTIGTSDASADMACASDAFRFCSTEIPDQTRIKSCLLRNIRDLTPECRAQFREGRVRHSPVPHRD